MLMDHATDTDMCLLGGPGSGKTTIVRAMYQMEVAAHWRMPRTFDTAVEHAHFAHVFAAERPAFATVAPYVSMSASRTRTRRSMRARGSPSPTRRR